LIIAALLGVIAGLLALQGKSKIQVATPVSEQNTESVTEDVEWARAEHKRVSTKRSDSDRSSIR